MNSADFVKTFTEFWTSQGEAMLKAQERAARAMTEGMQAMATGAWPGFPGGGNSAELSRASQALADLWSAATALSGELAGKLGPATLAGGGDETVSAVFGRIADPRQWMAGTGEMDDVLGRMAEGPRLADLWEVERRYARVVQAWVAVRRSGMEHNAVVLQGWLDAGQRFLEESGAPGEKQDARAIMRIWTEVANRQLLAMQRSEPFLKTQREMIRTGTELRMAQQELVEHFGNQYGFPTRTEIDDVHRTVTELRREMRAMRRQMVSKEAPQSVVQAVAAPAIAAAAAPAPAAAKGKARAPAPARRNETRKREVH